MNQEDVGKDQIIRQLIACQERINETEKLHNHQEEALRQAKALFESVFELAPDALLVVDRQAHITAMNTQAERLFGYTREELIGKDHGVLIPDRLRAKHETELKAFMAQPRVRVMGIGLELRGRRKDGAEFPADIDLGPLQIGGQFSVLAVVRDETKRQQLEVDLLESEKRYRQLVDFSPDAVVVSTEGKIAFGNAAAARLFGVGTVENLLGRPEIELVHPEHREIARDRARQILEKGIIPPLIEQKVLRPDGSDVYVDVVSMPYVYRGAPAILSIVRDITERRRAELARKESDEELQKYRQRLEVTIAERTAEFARANEKLTREIEERTQAQEGLLLRAAILDNASEAIFLINPRGEFAYANEAAFKTYGYNRDEFLNMDLHRLLRPQDAPLIDSRLKEVLQKGQLELEVVHVRKDGSLMPVRVRHSSIKTLHGEFIVSVMRDISSESELRMLEQGIPGVLWATDSELRLTASVGAGLELIGLKPGQGIGMQLPEYVAENGLGEEVLSAHRRALAGESVSFEFKIGKEKRIYYGRAMPLRQTQGDLVGTISIILDATDYKSKMP